MVNATLIKINTVEVPKLAGMVITRNKKYSTRGNNLIGNIRQVYLGTWVSISLDFVAHDRATHSTLISMFSPSSVTVEWFDEETDSIKSGTYITSDFETELINNDLEIYENFSITLVPLNKIS